MRDAWKGLALLAGIIGATAMFIVILALVRKRDPLLEVQERADRAQAEGDVANALHLREQANTMGRERVGERQRLESLLEELAMKRAALLAGGAGPSDERLRKLEEHIREAEETLRYLMR